jgi:hypothetical protein
MKILRTLLLSAVLAPLAAGCAMQMQPEAANVRRIAVVEPQEPESYSAEVSHPFGVLGRVADTLRGRTLESDTFTAAVKAQGFYIANRFGERTAQALRAQGYDVVLVRNAYRVRDGITHLDFDKSTVDALLTFDLDTVGFLAPRGDAPFQPALAVAVSLDPTAVLEYVPLYKARYMYGWQGHVGTWTHLPAPAQYAYSSHEDLMARRAEAVQVLHAGADAIAARIGQDLARKR